MKTHQFVSLSRYPWEAMITIRTDGLENEDEAYRAIQSQLIRPLSQKFGDVIAAIGVHTRLRGNHAHLLVFSKKRPIFKGLTSEGLYEILRSAGSTLASCRKSVDVQQRYDEGAEGYVVSNLPERSGKGGWLFFNLKLLKRREGKARQ